MDGGGGGGAVQAPAGQPTEPTEDTGGAQVPATGGSKEAEGEPESDPDTDDDMASVVGTELEKQESESAQQHKRRIARMLKERRARKKDEKQRAGKSDKKNKDGKDGKERTGVRKK